VLPPRQQRRSARRSASKGTPPSKPVGPPSPNPPHNNVLLVMCVPQSSQIFFLLPTGSFTNPVDHNNISNILFPDIIIALGRQFLRTGACPPPPGCAVDALPFYQAAIARLESCLGHGDPDSMQGNHLSIGSLLHHSQRPIGYVPSQNQCFQNSAILKGKRHPAGKSKI